ncbi:fatty acyl-AMP ligase [Microbispora sp. NPDC049125]|uniref:fatty acyl-AMP ligase n=1 Tax=Microbispora sp. NPDC049125 TaxID=3154929 RepID=UPI003465F7AB
MSERNHAEQPNMVAVLRDRAADQGDQPATVFLPDSPAGEVPLTYAELDEGARRVGAWLQARIEPGDRVLLMNLPGNAFLIGFFGCLYGGAIAVPAPPPDGLRRSLDRLIGIVTDAGVTAVLTETSFAPLVEAWVAESGAAPAMACASVDDSELADPAAWRMPVIEDSTVAFLQYTSGSTSEPKGVVVTHGNLIDNQREIHSGIGSRPGMRAVGWLPHFHDMGLIGQFLHPIYMGGTLYFMSPLSFLKRPVRWLEAFGRYGATDSAAPNFAYDLATRRVTDAQLATLDLSSWEYALNGSEPIQAATLNAFAERFAPAGFRATTLAPCYGLAESTLFVTATPRQRGMVELAADPAALEAGQTRPAPEGMAARSLVSSGRASRAEVRIVAPGTGSTLPEGTIGEIWLRSRSVAAGYWNHVELTEEIFRATTAEGERGFLRTGDLGAVYDGELYVTGRIKEMMIINGRNLYPQDIEHAIRQLHPALAQGVGAAFTLGTQPERMVLLHEIKVAALGGLSVSALTAKVMEHVRATFEVPLSAVLLVPRGTVERTTSGKVQRGRMRELYLAGEVRPLGDEDVFADAGTVGR